MTDLDRKPLRGAQVEIWQCDEHGHYTIRAMAAAPTPATPKTSCGAT